MFFRGGKRLLGVKMHTIIVLLIIIASIGIAMSLYHDSSDILKPGKDSGASLFLNSFRLFIDFHVMLIHVALNDYLWFIVGYKQNQFVRISKPPVSQ